MDVAWLNSVAGEAPVDRQEEDGDGSGSTRMREQVEKTIEVIRPALQADGGDIACTTSTRRPVW